MTDAIAVDDLRKVYRSRGGEPVRALDGVSLRVPQGRIHGLLGPNGAGKSTLVKVLATVTPPTSGSVAVLGCDAVRQPLEVRRRLAVVMQQTAAEVLLTVRDNLLVYAYLHGLSPRVAHERLRAVAEEFELGDRLGDTAQELSIGTKRRIQVAKVFMLDAPVVVLDEATTGMDPLMKRRVMERLRSEAKRGRTILLTTQVLSEAEELCETITILDRGHTMASGTLAELRQRSQHMLIPRPPCTHNARSTTSPLACGSPLWYRVALTFASTDDVLVQRLQALAPLELRVEGNVVELLFSGEESALLSKLADLSRQTPILQFEVRGPTLEEIFVRLVEEGR